MEVVAAVAMEVVTLEVVVATTEDKPHPLTQALHVSISSHPHQMYIITVTKISS